MTSQLSGSENIDAAFCRPLSRSLHEGHHQPSRSLPHHSATLSFSGSTNGARNSEPVSKRQKLEGYTGSVNFTVPGASQELRDSASITLVQRGSGSKAVPSHLDDLDHPHVLTERCNVTRGRILPFLPARPCHNSSTRHSKQNETASTERVSIRKEVQTKPYEPESPPAAPKYRKEGPADYHPWIGNHPEDTLNESTTKQGFFDKIQVSQNETNTARPSVWSSLKHKSGLQILSSLFISALDQRQIHGTVAANCTFKPPPRVTLTDTKREAWLRDLADASIPLRRLSRTIPHGIRGKSLLDQCLAKDIPITRAVWLAKCVGANEIRAFKRKGASGAFAIGGEDKWIKDWTTNVEAFVESVADECGTPNWRHRINYSLRIVTHLFYEHLLDREHYMNWVISSLQNCNLDNISFWLLVIRIYWKEILRFRQHGKRLTEILSEQMFRTSEHLNQRPFAAVLRELAQFSSTIMKLAPACFLLPLSWDKYENLLKSNLEEESAASVQHFEKLSQRNFRLRRPSTNVARSSIRLSERNLITLLDKLSFDVDPRDFAHTCLATIYDHAQLITICLDWATSLTRFGHARTYFIIRLFRRLAKLDINLEQPILGFLASKPDLPQLQKANIYRVLAELVQSKNLSVGRYLQWLIAKGAITGHKNVDGTYSSSLQWLFELPLHGLPAPILNLRQILISSVGGYAKDEIDNIAATKAKVVAQIPEFFSPSYVPAEIIMHTNKSDYLSHTVKSTIGQWIRQAVASFFVPHTPGFEGDDPSTDEVGRGIPTLANLEQFRTIRTILESFEDFSVLADIVNIFSKCIDVKILAEAADTVNCHFETFSAIGAVHGLFERLYRRHENICEQKALEKPFVESLADLGCRLRRPAREIRKLRAELAFYEQKYPAAVCSPVSDNMAELLQPAELSFVDEVEQVLSSGTIMEKHTLNKIFETITERIRMSWRDSMAERPLINFPELFIQLKAFDLNGFTVLVQDWLDNLFLSQDRPSLLKILPPFICANTICLSTVLERTGYLLDTTKHESNTAALAVETLELMVMTNLDLPSLAPCKEYRFYIQQHRIIRESSSLVAPILHAAIEACTDTESQLSKRARSFVKSVGSRQIIQGLLQQQSETNDAISRALGVGLYVHEVQNVIDSILYSSDRPVLTESTICSELSKLLLNVNILNAPLCKLKLKAILDTATQFNHRAAEMILSILKDRARSEDFAIIDIWAILLSALPFDQARQIREAAESEILSYLHKALELTPSRCEGVLHSMIAIVGATANSISDSAASSVIVQVTERIMSLLSSSQLVEIDCGEYLLHKDTGSSVDGSGTYVDILLRLLTIHYSAVQLSRSSENGIISLVVALSLLLTHPSLHSCSELAEHVFDVLVLITDSLTDETRSQCFRTLRDKHRLKDPRLIFIFGYPENIESEWLQLSTASWAPSAIKSEGSTRSPMISHPFPLRKWEMMQEATPLTTENDTSLSLTLFGTRRAVL